MMVGSVRKQSGDEEGHEIEPEAVSDEEGPQFELEACTDEEEGHEIKPEDGNALQKAKRIEGTCLGSLALPAL